MLASVKGASALPRWGESDSEAKEGPQEPTAAAGPAPPHCWWPAAISQASGAAPGSSAVQNSETAVSAVRDQLTLWWQLSLDVLLVVRYGEGFATTQHPLALSVSRMHVVARIPTFDFPLNKV